MGGILRPAEIRVKDDCKANGAITKRERR